MIARIGTRVLRVLGVPFETLVRSVGIDAPMACWWGSCRVISQGEQGVRKNLVTIMRRVA